LIIDNTGTVIGIHRKLVPTWAEKLTWTSGDGSSLKVYDTEIGPIGTLACGENTNTLARFTLLSQGELIHVANYISLPVAPPDYDMAEAIKIRAAAHSFEGKLFTIVSCSTISQEIKDALRADVPNVDELLTRKNSAFSGFVGPNGAVIGEPLIDDEGIAYAEIDLQKYIDQVYPDWSVKDKEDFDQVYTHLKADVMENLAPFIYYPHREEEFEKQFDGIKVLPSIKAKEYRELLEANKFIKAESLKVSITRQRFASLISKEGIHRDVSAFRLLWKEEIKEQSKLRKNQKVKCYLELNRGSLTRHINRKHKN